VIAFEGKYMYITFVSGVLVVWFDITIFCDIYDLAAVMVSALSLMSIIEVILS